MKQGHKEAQNIRKTQNNLRGRRQGVLQEGAASFSGVVARKYAYKL